MCLRAAPSHRKAQLRDPERYRAAFQPRASDIIGLSSSLSSLSSSSSPGPAGEAGGGKPPTAKATWPPPARAAPSKALGAAAPPGGEPNNVRARRAELYEGEDEDEDDVTDDRVASKFVAERIALPIFSTCACGHKRDRAACARAPPARGPAGGSGSGTGRGRGSGIGSGSGSGGAHPAVARWAAVALTALVLFEAEELADVHELQLCGA